jgi:hypothetical protein
MTKSEAQWQHCCRSSGRSTCRRARAQEALSEAKADTKRAGGGRASRGDNALGMGAGCAFCMRVWGEENGLAADAAQLPTHVNERAGLLKKRLAQGKLADGTDAAYWLVSGLWLGS